jgi:hypothetical protein
MKSNNQKFEIQIHRTSQPHADQLLYCSLQQNAKQY